MKEAEILSKLNENKNFQMTLKTIQISDVSILQDLKNTLQNYHKTSVIITDMGQCYDLLSDAYHQSTDYVLIDENITFLLPLFIGITKDCTNIIKPMIPVYYMLKDNKIIQHVKTKCHIGDIPFHSVKTENELIAAVIQELNIK